MKTPSLIDSRLEAEFSIRPGLIPISVDESAAESPSGGILWCDLDRYHCYEGFFAQSLASYTALSSAPPARFLSSLGALARVPLQDSLAPSGFIFHPGRCGSTLLAKVFARSRDNLVFSEAAPHNAVWRVLPASRASAVDFYRHLILAMGRRRLASYQSHFIKFTSYNIWQFALIREAFPDVPAVFLFRHPDAVLESSVKEVQPWLGVDVGVGRTWNDAGEALRDFCRTALSIRDAAFRFLDYREISPRNLDSILDFFHSKPSSPREKTLMESEFLWDAKNGRVPRHFVPGPAAAPRSDSCLLGLYSEMVDRSRSDWE